MGVWQDGALIVAGLIGSSVAIVHGMLTQRLMVRPVAALFIADGKISAPIKRLVPLLLHLSTVSWFAGGVALVASALWFEPSARLATGLCIGALYLYGALANLWGTRGRHPGWVLYTIAVILIAIGVRETGV